MSRIFGMQTLHLFSIIVQPKLLPISLCSVFCHVELFAFHETTVHDALLVVWVDNSEFLRIFFLFCTSTQYNSVGQIAVMYLNPQTIIHEL